MKYCSTRGGETALTFQQALFSGYAADGGLYMPENVPVLDPDELEHWSKLSYRQLVLAIATKFIAEDEIPQRDLKKIVESAYQNFNPGKELDLVNINKNVGGKDNDGNNSSDMWILELFHGPTLAFKDLTLAFVASVLEYYLAKQERHVSILVGTSGDTGGASIAAIEGRANMELVVLLPRGRCSQPQYLQMVTSAHSNITTYSVEGTSDDLDEPIKELFKVPETVKRHNLLSINSINIGRILPQIAHFMYVYFRRRQCIGDKLEVVIPTGAAGNMTSACLAHALGLPLTVVCAVNKNDIVGRMVTTGHLSVSGHVLASLSSAMDIQIPYNVERIIHHYSKGNTAQVAAIMTAFEKTGSAVLTQGIMASMKEVITGCCVYDDEAVLKTIRRTYDEHHYLICPHTAQAVTHHYQCPPSSSVSRVYVAPASPAKFPDVITRALTETAEPRLPRGQVQDIVQRMGQPLDDLRALALVKGTKELRMDKGQDWHKMLLQKLEEINASWLK